jgi:hypothetical protein
MKPLHDTENDPALFVQQASCQRRMTLKEKRFYEYVVGTNKQMLTFYPVMPGVCPIDGQSCLSPASTVLNLLANRRWQRTCNSMPIAGGAW